MDYNFNNEAQFRVPVSAYQPYKRCEYCQSVYLTDNICESCGRSVRFDVIGKPFGYKSYYGIKERYINELPWLVQRYPIFETTTSDQAQALVRQLRRRLLLLGQLQEHDDLELFFVEAYAIINELLFYSVSMQIIEADLGNHIMLKNYLIEVNSSIVPKKPWLKEMLEFKVLGTMRVTFILQLITMLVSLIMVVNWQYGK